MKFSTYFRRVIKKFIFGQLLFITLFATAQSDKYNFFKINTYNGLSHNQVNAILKDSMGFLWFGTMSGLNRYDGYSVKVFRKKPNDSTTINDNSVLYLAALPGAKMWVMTKYGPCIYNTSTEKFDSDYSRYLMSLGLPTNAFIKIFKGNYGRYWFLYDNGDLFEYDEPHKTAKLIYKNTSGKDEAKLVSLQEIEKNQMWMVFQNGAIQLFDLITRKVVKECTALRHLNQSNVPYSLFVDRDGDLWLWHYINGVYFLHPDDNTIRWFNEKSFPNKLSSNLISQLVQDNQGLIWVATDHGGVTIIDKKNNFHTAYILNDPKNPKSLSHNSVITIYKDDKGIIWLGTYKQGVNSYNSDIVQFPLFRHAESNPTSLQYDDVNRFAEDKSGNIWIGTNGGGLIYFDRSKNTFRQFLHSPQNVNSVCADVIVSLCIDHEGKLWIGTFQGGLDMYDGKKFTHYIHEDNNPASISDNNVWEIFEDREQNLWIGILGGGLERYNRENNQFEHHRAEEKNGIVGANYISAILQDKKGNLWIGSVNGITVFNTKTQFQARYLYTPHKNSLSNNNVNCLIEDYKGRIWIGTTDGLNLLNPETNTFKVFTAEDGLPDNIIWNIIEDGKHSFWISTPNGLCNAIPSEKNNQVSLTFINYDETNNLQSQEFNDNAAFKTRKGELFFGGTSGFNIINSSFINPKVYSPGIVFTNLQVLNKNIEPGDIINNRVLLKQSISQAGKINLKYNENSFSIQFASLDFEHSLKQKYAYMLKGFNADWIYTDGSQRIATYTNIDPGHYTFKVKVLNRDGLWSEVKEMEILVKPPFWRTTIAYLIYIVVFAGLLYLARKITLDRIHMRYEVAEQRREAERTHAMEQLKTKFFTNVSHEFRTPLSLIIAPLDKLIKQSTNEDQKVQLNLVQRNAKRLLGLVNQLLDFRKIQVQEMKLHPSFGDIIGFIKEISLSFLDLAEKKRIQFSFSTNTEHLEIYFDKDKLEKILFNLLSNAFKYTNDAGKVDVQLSYEPKAEQENEGTISIEVKDTGIGISAENQDKIFERYFQTDLPDTMVNQGTGIGLAITKEFVRLHNGIITVKSEPGKGTSFTVLLPAKKTMEVVNTHTISGTIPVDFEHTQEEKGKTGIDKSKNKKTVLIIEDNEDMRFYLKDNLKADYQVAEASNGKEGWERVKQLMPDLVVSDIMMPEMNGIELAKRIKTETQTAHIPVILLTAIGSEEKQLEGLQIGVNDYITKPFTFEILASRIKNILAQQKLLHARFEKQLEVNPKDVTITQVDEKFLQNALEIITENMTDPEFSVENLSQALFMTRVTLYRKILSITGKTPIEFIRSIRLKKAALLLAKSGKSIAEVAYETGFSSPKKFAKSFKEEFNVLPSQYMKK